MQTVAGSNAGVLYSEDGAASGGSVTIQFDGVPAGIATTINFEGITGGTVVGGVATIPHAPSAASGNPPTVTTPIADQSGGLSPVNLDIAGNFNDPDGDTLTFTAAPLPPGITLSSAGLFSGTPTTAGTTTVAVTANDGNGNTVTDTFDWVITTAINALGTATFDNGTNTLTVTSSSTPGMAEALNDLLFTLTAADTGQVNDGRVITVQFSSHTDVSAVVVDSRGLVTNAMIVGNGASWDLVFSVGASAGENDLILTGAGTITVDLQVTDTSTATDTASNI